MSEENMNKFNKVYSDIINENYKTFPCSEGSINLPQQYLVNLPQVKQCVVSNHSRRAKADEDNAKLNYTISDEILYKNIQLFLEKIFNDIELVRKINRSEIESYSIECICSTQEKFDNDQNKHLIIPLMINAKEINGKYEYYVAVKTIEIKNKQEYDVFAKQGYKSIDKKRKFQIPVLTIGESIE